MAALPFNKERSFGLLVGVGKRDEDSGSMAITASDAKHLGLALVNFNLFAEKHITALRNAEANRSDILKALDALAEKTKQEPADLILFYFSGHGSEVGGRYYLISRDTTGTDIENTGIAGSLLVEKLTAIQCDKMLVLPDCCHAAGVTEVPIPFDETRLLEVKNRVILTACARHQVSYLSSPVSIFTYAVIEALGGKFLNGPDDKEVNVLNLAMDVRERVVALSEQVLKPDKIQKPQLNVFEKSGTTNYALARYPKGGAQEIRLFKEEFSALESYEGKALDMDAKSKPDNKYRENFNWMLSVNTIRDIGDGNFILQGIQGPVTIHQGISMEQLRELFALLTTARIKEFKTALNDSADQNARALEQKIDAALKLEEQEKQILEDNLELLIKKLGALARAHTLAYDALKQFSLEEEIQKTNNEISDIKKRLSVFR